MSGIEVIGVSGVVVVDALLVASLWKKSHVRLRRKVAWTFVVVTPILGWLAYGGLFEPPPKNSRRPPGDASGWTPHRRNL